MARPQKPWFRMSKNTWYATVNGKKVSLGTRSNEIKRDNEIGWESLSGQRGAARRLLL
jgi:hypothetical protein